MKKKRKKMTRIEEPKYFTVSRKELTMLFTFFLKHHKCYHSFKGHSAKFVIKHDKGMSKLQGLLTHFTELNSLNSPTYVRTNVFMTAFNWKETPEGSVFWYKLHYDWGHKFLDHLSVDDEARQGVNKPWMEHVFKTLINL